MGVIEFNQGEDVWFKVCFQRQITVLAPTSIDIKDVFGLAAFWQAQDVCGRLGGVATHEALNPINKFTWGCCLKKAIFLLLI